MTTEASFTATHSVVETRPRMREEVREEIREEIRVLDLPRVEPEDKLRLERLAVEGAVGDVELFEKTWRKTQPETLAEIQRRVDALGSIQLPLPAAGAARAASAMPPPGRRSLLDVTPAPAPLPGPSGRLGPRLAPAEQRAVTRHVGGDVERIRVLYTTSRGRVCEVQFKKGKEPQSMLVVLGEGDKVETLDAIGSKLDAMPMPVRGPPEPPQPLPAAPELHMPAPMPAPAAPPPSRPTPTQEGQDIEAIEGIGPAYGAKLRAAGVATVEDLIAADARAVALETGIVAELVHKWQDMGRLQAVNGIGPQYSELLVRAGVRTFADLARQTPEGLAKRLNDYEDSLEVRVQGNVVTPDLAGEWIRQAHALAGPARAAPSGSATQVIPSPAAKAAAPAKPAAKRGFGLKLGKKAAEPAEAAPAEEAPKKKGFGLSLGRKAKDAPADAPAGDAPEPPKKKGLFKR